MRSPRRGVQVRLSDTEYGGDPYFDNPVWHTYHMEHDWLRQQWVYVFVPTDPDDPRVPFWPEGVEPARWYLADVRALTVAGPPERSQTH